ncbi:hypothetical protein DFP74_3594 [Nocardiopsis sp. Huas11]|uniref:hypothetical protein n=1 Tax=Nocardiopsis sp. Huas11 TaxID=2183912 RepID=UPI000EAD1FEA|nr:hypothetical protein [Nocardiopsis sp. Huas11]RKS07906.1 hypothetical protein DFP74_3594 [Nocardiopsis sp. Huas11]
MTEVHALPALIVPKEWDGVDTSIDAEIPELLSEDQFDRYVQTVADLVRTAGLNVVVSENDHGHLDVSHPDTGFTLELDLRDDRSAEWALSADDETEPGTPALQTASLVDRLLSSGQG